MHLRLRPEEVARTRFRSQRSSNRVDGGMIDLVRTYPHHRLHSRVSYPHAHTRPARTPSTTRYSDLRGRAGGARVTGLGCSGSLITWAYAETGQPAWGGPIQSSMRRSGGGGVSGCIIRTAILRCDCRAFHAHRTPQTHTGRLYWRDDDLTPAAGWGVVPAGKGERR
jgi:hypothetical protein